LLVGFTKQLGNDVVYDLGLATSLTDGQTWNRENRYAKAHTFIQKDKRNNARIEIDVLVAGTQADPAQTFRAYFTKMKNAAGKFRNVVGKLRGQDDYKCNERGG